FSTLFKSDVNKTRKDKSGQKPDKKNSGSETPKKPVDRSKKPLPMPVGDRHYFAYGSNMNDEDLARWCNEKSKPVVNLRTPKVAVLQDYDLAWNYFSNTRKGGVANIMPERGSHVEGVLFELSETDLEVIAQKEGRDTYKRITVSVSLREGGTVEGVVTFEVYEDLASKSFIP